MRYTTCIAALLMLPLLSFARKEKKIKYGISLGAQQSSFCIKTYDASYYKSVLPSSGTGFRLGLLANYPLSKRWSVTAKPEMAFYGSTISTLRIDNDAYKWETVPMAELAADIRYKLPLKVVQPYLYAGPTYKYALGKSTANEPTLNGSFLCVDAGVGVEKKFKKFTLAPELRYSYGLSRIATVCNMSPVYMNTAVLVLNFKGI